MEKLAVTDDPVTFDTPILTSVSGEIVVLPVAKFVPINDTLLSLPRIPKFGWISVSVGVPEITVNSTVALVPLGVTTLTL